mgnify:CR=1 FL=1
MPEADAVKESRQTVKVMAGKLLKERNPER